MKETRGTKVVKGLGVFLINIIGRLLTGGFFHPKHRRAPSDANLRFNCSRALSPPEKRRETQLRSWQRRGRYVVTQAGPAALNSTLGKVAFVKRRTMASSVEGAQVDFQLLSEDTRYPPFLCVRFGDKLSISRPF